MRMPPPKFATERDPSRPTRGTRQAAFADIWLQQPLMPWQQLVADVAGELNHDGHPVYPLVVVTLPRQAGKSHLALTKTGERCFSRPNTRSWYTAQTGGDARDQFLKFVDENIAGRPMEKMIRTLRGNGHEVMKFPNGSSLRPHPPTEAALHGKQSDVNDIDEAWEFDELQGKALLQAIAPTQLTRPGAQTWIWSAGGTAASTWLASLVARGRGGDPSMAYFEWGIPDDLDINDLEAVASHHPAYGHTITLDSIRNIRTGAFADDDPGFARAIGNRWTEIIGGAIPADVWEAARYEHPIPDDAHIAYAAATSLDRTQTAIVAAAEVDGVVVVEVLDILPPRTSETAATVVAGWAGSADLAVDRIGPSASLADSLTRTRSNLLDLTTRDVGAACANFIDGLTAGSIKVRPHPALDDSVRVAAKRGLGDGAYLWARKTAGSPIAALEAATLAVWALGHRAPVASKPKLYFPGEEIAS